MDGADTTCDMDGEVCLCQGDLCLALLWYQSCLLRSLLFFLENDRLWACPGFHDNL